VHVVQFALKVVVQSYTTAGGTRSKSHSHLFFCVPLCFAWLFLLYSRYIFRWQSASHPLRINAHFPSFFFLGQKFFFFCVRRTAKVSELSSRWNIVESSVSWQLDGATDWRIDERFSTYQIDCHEMFSFKYI